MLSEDSVESLRSKICSAK